MARFLIDEDLPRSLAQRLRASGVEARDVREVGLRGESDTAILKHAVDHGFALISADLGFSNLLQFPLGTHAGILVVRIPNEVPTSILCDVVLRAVKSLSDSDIAGNLIIIDPHRIRLRRG